MIPIYLGVDIAGADNTWVAALVAADDGCTIVLEPCRHSLKQIVTYCRTETVAAVAIDAQLTMSLAAEKGFRPSDWRLRELLPADCRNWVASVNSLMSVPVRGQVLTDFLAPYVGTILETHPRASLYFALGNLSGRPVQNYKGQGTGARKNVLQLWEQWSKRYGISSEPPPNGDGALDALVCATVAYLYHHAPETLLRLTGDDAELRGRGPFYVVASG
jgi:predicted nuclease with RNAse H fold